MHESPEPPATSARRQLSESSAASARIAASLVALIYIAIAVALHGDSGPTWDCALGDYAYGQATWDALMEGSDPVAVYEQRLAKPRPEHAGLRHADRERHPEFAARDFRWSQMFPLASTLSAATCELFWQHLAWLPPLAAHHFAVTLFVALLLYALTTFVTRETNVWGGVLAALLLISAPRFFAHAQNNLKDVPEACLYGLASIAFYSASSRRGLWRWCVVGVLVGLGLAQKQNALFLPVQFAATLILWWIVLPEERRWRERALIPGAISAAVACVLTWVAVSPWMWNDPLRAVVHFREVTSVSGVGAGRVSWNGPYLALVTTPLPLMVFGVLGGFSRVGSLRLVGFLSAWIGVVLGRLLLPGMRNFDGVRHFLEFLPPLAVLAALGVIGVWRRASLSGIPRLAFGTLLGLSAVLPGAVATARTHPNGIAYFNSLVGGLSGAQADGLRDATDYWGNVYWQALDWLSMHAPADAQIFVPIAPEVARVGAGRLRSDLRFWQGAEVGNSALCIAYITRRGWYGPLVRHLESNFVPTHEIEVQRAPILRLYVIESSEQIAEVVGLRLREIRAEAARLAVLAWCRQQPREHAASVLRAVRELPQVGWDESLARLTALLPETLHAEARDVLWSARGSVQLGD